MYELVTAEDLSARDAAILINSYTTVGDLDVVPSVTRQSESFNHRKRGFMVNPCTKTEKATTAKVIETMSS